LLYRNSPCLCVLYIGFLKMKIFSRFYAIVIEEKYRTLEKKISNPKMACIMHTGIEHCFISCYTYHISTLPPFLSDLLTERLRRPSKSAKSDNDRLMGADGNVGEFWVLIPTSIHVHLTIFAYLSQYNNRPCRTNYRVIA
jgi:hypothetical protein